MSETHGKIILSACMVVVLALAVGLISHRSIADKNTFTAHTLTVVFTGDDWGNVSHDTGSTDQPYQFVGRLGYYTHWQDGNLTLLQLGVRFYDPKAGRFTQVDEVDSHNVSAYAYVGNSPGSWTDPSGFTRQYVGNDATLKKCLDKLIGCIPDKKIRSTIPRVGVYVDDKLPSDVGAEPKHYTIVCCGHSPVVLWIPRIIFSPRGGEHWSQRHTRFDQFCKRVLHELLHVSAPWLVCRFGHGYLERKDPDHFEKIASEMYDKYCSEK